MALKPAILKDLEQQLTNIGITDVHLPTLADKKDFVASQLEGTQKVAYRTVVDIEVARVFAKAKDEASNETARQRFEEGIASLKALKPTIEVLSEIAKELDAVEE